LVAIAIGVGVSASAWNAKLYGPSWGRFTVSFPAAPNLCGHKINLDCDNDGVPTWYAEKLGRTTFEDVSVTVQRQRGPWTTAKQFVRLAKNDMGEVWTLSQVGDLTILVRRLWCSGVCQTYEMAANSQALWSVGVIVGPPDSLEMFPPGTALPRANYRQLRPIAERLLASFQPVG